MRINLQNQSVANFYEELESEAIFVGVQDFEKFIGDNLPSPMLPPFMIAGEGILLRYRHLKMIGKSLGIHIQRYKLTKSEGGFLTAKLDWWKPPKGDIMNRAIRQHGSFGSRK